MLGLIAVSALLGTQRQTTPEVEVRKRIAAMDAAFNHKDYKSALKFIAPDAKFFDHKGNIVPSSYCKEQMRRMFEQAKSITSKCEVQTFNWDGKVATVLTKTDLKEVLGETGNVYRNVNSSRDEWVRVRGVFKLAATHLMTQREYLNGVFMHGGTIH